MAFYGASPSPADGTVWGTSLGFPGYVVRLDPTKPNPSETALAEIYEVPAPGYGPRGMDIDSQNVVWVPLSSGHMASFDRRKCKVLNGPTIRDGKHCPEGWTLYPFPGRSSPATPAPDRPRRATTPGSTSTTRWASARTFRLPPAIRTSR